jgi:hypothetical protein
MVYDPCACSPCTREHAETCELSWSPLQLIRAEPKNEHASMPAGCLTDAAVTCNEVVLQPTDGMCGQRTVKHKGCFDKNIPGEEERYKQVLLGGHSPPLHGYAHTFSPCNHVLSCKRSLSALPRCYTSASLRFRAPIGLQSHECAQDTPQIFFLCPRAWNCTIAVCAETSQRRSTAIYSSLLSHLPHYSPYRRSIAWQLFHTSGFTRLS